MLAAVGIAATLGIKIGTGGTPTVPARAESQAMVDAFLGDKGFQVVTLRQEPPLKFHAFRRSDCEMLTGIVSLIGAEERIIQQMVPDGWRLTYVFRGQTFAAAPKMDAITTDYLNRGLWLFDRAVGFDPIVAAIHRPTCVIDEMDWQGLARVPYKRRSFVS